MKKAFLAALLLSAGGLALAPLAAPSAWATPISPSPTIVSGPLTFNNFTCNVVGGAGLSCGAIGVVGYVSVSPPDAIAGENGIQIQGAFNASPATEDVAITYLVSVGGGHTFTDAEMFFNGTAVSSVSELIFDNATGALLGSLFVTNPPPIFTDTILLPGSATTLKIVKDIGLAFNGKIPGTISLVDQNFSISVPEPASLLLLGTALIGIGVVGFARRRRRT